MTSNRQGLSSVTATARLLPLTAFTTSGPWEVNPEMLVVRMPPSQGTASPSSLQHINPHHTSRLQNNHVWLSPLQTSNPSSSRPQAPDPTSWTPQSLDPEEGSSAPPPQTYSPVRPAT